MSPVPSLQHSSLFVARGYRHDALAPNPGLSVKCMFNGSALYHSDRSWFAVNETGYLILNEHQPYEIHIDSPTLVESFIIFFPEGWAERAFECVKTPSDKLLEDPERKSRQPIHFFERLTRHDKLVSPLLSVLRSAHKKGPLPDIWLEQKLWQLLGFMLQTQNNALRESDALRAKCAAKRRK